MSHFHIEPPEAEQAAAADADEAKLWRGIARLILPGGPSEAGDE